MTVTISRITFENRGQDFLWWEVDMETGRILGCGPMQADVWASGHCSIALETMVAGQRPRFFGRATEAEGRLLTYRIADVRPVAGKDGDMVWGFDFGSEFAGG